MGRWGVGGGGEYDTFWGREGHYISISTNAYCSIEITQSRKYTNKTETILKQRQQCVAWIKFNDLLQ